MYQGGEFFKFYFDSRDLAPKPVQASCRAGRFVAVSKRCARLRTCRFRGRGWARSCPS
jgi:hypothetical protein